MSEEMEELTLHRTLLFAYHLPRSLHVAGVLL